jgi:hypothetical protein
MNSKYSAGMQSTGVKRSFDRRTTSTTNKISGMIRYTKRLMFLPANAVTEESWTNGASVSQPMNTYSGWMLKRERRADGGGSRRAGRCGSDEQSGYETA